MKIIQRNWKTEVKKSKEDKRTIERITSEMNGKGKSLVDINSNGVSNWLTVPPFAEFGLELPK